VWTKIFLSLGSNLGERKKNIEHAFVFLMSKIKNAEISCIYETQPMYIKNQPKFLNAAMSGYTLFSSRALLKYIHSIEKKLGRNRNKEIEKGPRPIDIDILLFGNEIIATNKLKIPHPAIEERKFVLIPLLELDPDLLNPKTGKLFSKSLPDLGDQGVYYHSFSRYTKSHKRLDFDPL